jgi:hypothetical protein
MAAFTLAEAQAKLDEVSTAYSAALQSQELTVGNRRVRRPDLKFLRADMEYWGSQVTKLSRGGIRLTGGTL